MNRAALAIVGIAGSVCLSSCDANPAEGAPPAEGSTASATARASNTPSPAAAQSEYARLSKRELDNALVSTQDLPVGYSQRAENATPTKTFCDYMSPFSETVMVTRDFTKGGGLSVELLRIGLRQYKNAHQASAVFYAMTRALKTCDTETYNGTTMTYAVMSAPKVGDDSVGIYITADNRTLLQNYALVGPTLVTAGTGGLINADSNAVAQVLQQQVGAYQAAAAG
jgi:hypothetical protein